MTVKRSKNADVSSGVETVASCSEADGLTLAQVRAFLEHWSLADAKVTLAAHRENTVYRVDTLQGESFALRIRRIGYRSDIEINSELDWMAMLAQEGMHVPVPVAASDGNRVARVDKYRADLVTWLNGRPLGKSGEPLELTDSITTFRALGRTAAKLHLLSDHWTLPVEFKRPRWDTEALLGDTPLWGRFWDCEGLKSSDAVLLSRFRETASVAMTHAHDSLDTGLIHADLVRENILLDPSDPYALAVIDFDDGVVGYRLFEIATALGKNVDEPQYFAMREALIAGYRELRPIDTLHLDLFMAIRAATYVGWSAVRRMEAGGDARATRALRAAHVSISRWLDSVDS